MSAGKRCLKRETLESCDSYFSWCLHALVDTYIIGEILPLTPSTAMISDLPFDILKAILIRLAGSSEGASNLARFKSTCKAFHELSDDEDILKAVVFDDSLISGQYVLFQRINGLVTKCAQAGHRKAQFILAKVILVCSSELYMDKLLTEDSDVPPSLAQGSAITPVEEDILKSSFVAHFIPSCTQANIAPARHILHSDIVRDFLSQSSPIEITEMQPYLGDYMHYFLGCRGICCEAFLCLLDKLCLFVEFDYPQILELGEEMSDIYDHVYVAVLELVNIKEQYHGSELVNMNRQQHDVSSFYPCERIDVMIEHCRTLKFIIKDAIIGRHKQQQQGNITYDTEFERRYEEVASVLQRRATRCEELLLRFKRVASRFEEIRGEAVIEFESLFSLAHDN